MGPVWHRWVTVGCLHEPWSVDERLAPVDQDLLGEGGGAGDPYAGAQVGLADPAAGGALRADRDPAAGDDRGEQVRERGRSGREKSSARPGTANQAASPVSHSDTSAPEARAAAATVKAWLRRSGSSAPQVTLTTSGRVICQH